MSTGIFGDGEARAGRNNMQLALKAIRENWPISNQIRQMVINQMALVVGKSTDDRSKIAACKVLVAADLCNAKREATETPQQHEHHHKANVDVSELRVELLHDRQYLEYLRNHQGNCEPGAVCPDGGQTLEVRPALEDARPSDHGHDRGG